MSALVSLGLLGIAVAVGLFVNHRVRVLAIPILMAFGLLVGSVGKLGADPVFAGAGHVGLVLLLFFTSLFGNPRALRDGGGVGLPLAAYDLVLNFAVAWWIGGHFGWAAEDRLFLAGIMATSSTAVVLKVLGDEGRIASREGNVLVSMLMIEDWVFLGFYAFLGFRFADTHASSAFAWAFWAPLFVAFLLLLRAFREWIWSFRQREVLIVALTAIALLGAFLGGQAGMPEVGSAFTTGLVLSGSQGARFVRHDAPFVREGASALFFVAYGAQLGPTLSTAILPLIGYCLGGVLLVELLFIPVLARRLGLSRAESFLTGGSLVARGGKSAAFAGLYPQRADGPPLFPLAGVLAMALTPFAPLLVKIALWSSRSMRSDHRAPTESFSRSARGFLLPHAFRQRSSAGALEWWVLAEWITFAFLLATLAVIVPAPLRFGPAALAAACLPFLYACLRRLVSTSPRAPGRIHPGRPVNRLDAAFQHLPLFLSAPLGLLLLFAVFSPWSQATFPAILGALLLTALLLPWFKLRPRRAPSSRFVGRHGPLGVAPGTVPVRVDF